MKEDYDVVIVGAGMVGATLACALGQAGFNIALIDAADLKLPAAQFNSDDDYQLRVSALNLASKQLLSNLDIWASIEAKRIKSYQKIHVWDAAGDGLIKFDSLDSGEMQLGYIVENALVQMVLTERIKQFDNIELITPAKPVELSVNTDNAILTLDNGLNLAAKLVVGADGASSVVRKLSGIQMDQQQYKQQAIVATVKTAKHHEDTAWQKFMPGGPLAFLPLQKGYSSIVWSTVPEHADELSGMSDDAFCQALTQASDGILGVIEGSSPRAGFPLQRLHVNQYIKPRIALMGDAAHVIHPMAGQGVNLGLLDAAQLAEFLVIDREKNKKHDPGAMLLLRRYERYRKSNNQLMLITLDIIKGLFANTSKPINTLRNLGLNFVNKAGKLKQLFMRYAMGLSGELPALVRKK